MTDSAALLVGPEGKARAQTSPIMNDHECQRKEVNGSNLFRIKH